MRVLHLNTTDTAGGAARGAYWLHRALRDVGVDSLMMVDRKHSDDDTVLEVSSGARRFLRAARARLDRLPLRFYPNTHESYWSVGWFPHKMERWIRKVKPDVVHLHWISGGFIPIAELRRLNGPIVWSLRDMWSFTGGCHYAGFCERYRDRCGACPQLRSRREFDLSRSIFSQKQKQWQGLDLWAVPISHWLADQARASAILAYHPMEIIPNGVDIRRFRPADQRRARKRLGISLDRPIVAFGAVNSTTDKRKGFSKFRDAVNRLAREGWHEKVDVVVFGNSETPAEAFDPSLNVRFMGQLDDDNALAAIYSAADVTVVPSIQEAFGKTVIESFACGTPVVAFQTGGPADIIDHKHNGYLARPYDSKSLADGIEWCLADRARSAELGRRARHKAVTEYDILRVARRYMSLYQRILRRNHESP